MMGHQLLEQAALFYELSLERHVPSNHLLRSIDRFVELDGLRRELSSFYSTIGRPSIAPELMIRMLLVGYCFGIRSEQGIEGEKGLPSQATSRAIEEYLAVLDDAAFGAATEIVPKFISPADPAARWTAAHGGQAFFAYSTNYLIDVENAIIVDVEPTTAIRQAEVLAGPSCGTRR
jgi:hypothetical protein